jgi:hypothetical protein
MNADITIKDNNSLVKVTSDYYFKNAIPSDVLRIVFSYLLEKNLQSAGLVCKRFSIIVRAIVGSEKIKSIFQANHFTLSIRRSTPFIRPGGIDVFTTNELIKYNFNAPKKVLPIHVDGAINISRLGSKFLIKDYNDLILVNPHSLRIDERRIMPNAMTVSSDYKYYSCLHDNLQGFSLYDCEGIEKGNYIIGTRIKLILLAKDHIVYLDQTQNLIWIYSLNTQTSSTNALPINYKEYLPLDTGILLVKSNSLVSYDFQGNQTTSFAQKHTNTSALWGYRKVVCKNDHIFALQNDNKIVIYTNGQSKPLREIDPLTGNVFQPSDIVVKDLFVARIAAQTIDIWNYPLGVMIKKIDNPDYYHHFIGVDFNDRTFVASTDDKFLVWTKEEAKALMSIDKTPEIKLQPKPVRKVSVISYFFSGLLAPFRWIVKLLYLLRGA